MKQAGIDGHDWGFGPKQVNDTKKRYSETYREL